MSTLRIGGRGAGWIFLAAVMLWTSSGEGAEFTGRVTVAGTTGVESALIRLYRVSESGRDLASAVIVTRTSRSGEFTIKTVSAGLYLVEVEIEGQVAFRGPVSVAGPKTSKLIDVVPLGKQPFIEVTILEATDEVKIVVNGVQVMTWSLDGNKTRRVALRDGSNDFEVRIVNRGGLTGGARLFGGQQPEPWSCRVRVAARGGRELVLFDAKESSAGKGRHGREFVLGTAKLRGKASTGEVSLAEADTAAWRREAPPPPASAERRAPPPSF